MSKSTFFKQPGKAFFFDDPSAIAKRALSDFPDDCKRVIGVADDIVFNEEIDWLFQPGDDPEWVYAFNRTAFWTNLGQAYALTGDEKYALAFSAQLRHWIVTVPQTCEKAWRSIDAGLRLKNWLTVMRYFEASPAVGDDLIELFSDSVAGHADFLMGVWDPFNLMSNWGILSSRGLFMAGAMLPDSARTRGYMTEAARRLSLAMQMQVYRDGVHWEQSPMYHHEVLECYLDVVLLARRCGVPLPENIERQTRDMCGFILYSSKPDHRGICMGDSDSIDHRSLLTKSAALFGDGELKSRAYAQPCYDSLWELGETGLSEFEALEVSAPIWTDKAFSDSNNFYFRTGWDDLATFVHFGCGTLGAGHGHADKQHVDVFSRGEDILIDPGRYTYVFGEDRIRYKELRAHNTIMADGVDFYVCKDSWECRDLTRGVNQKFYADSRYGYAEGGHLAYIDRGIFINRRVIFLKPDIIVLADELYASGKHSYSQFFHFNSAGRLEGGGSRFFYRSCKAAAEVVFLADGLSCEMGEGRMSRKYNQEEVSGVLTTSFEGDGFTGAFTVIALSDAGREKELHVQRHSVSSTFKGVVFDSSQVEALSIMFGEQHFTVVVAHEEFASPTDTFEADGCIGFGSCVVFDRAAGETETGTVLLW